MRHIAVLLLLLASQAHVYGASIVINAFNSGELSPLLRGRTDVRKYYSGCEILENMLVLPYGGVSKRPGSYYIADAKSADTKCILIPFIHSTENSYVLEFGNQYMRLYRDGGQVQDGDDSYEISTPYVTADLFGLQFVQSADVIYIVGSNYYTVRWQPGKSICKLGIRPSPEPRIL